ncbi:MAG: hypothetical protein AAF677_07215 [Pseudomonadota bacterium]
MQELAEGFWLVGIVMVLPIVLMARQIGAAFRARVSLQRFVMDQAVFVALALWLLSYAVATRLEIESIALSYPEYEDQLVGFDIRALGIALGLAFCFGVMLYFYTNLFVLVPFVFLLGMIDISGNMQLTETMVSAYERALTAAQVQLPQQVIWREYYTEGGHLSRIATYIAIAFLGLVLFAAAKIDVVDPERLDEHLGRPGAAQKLGWMRRNAETLDIASKLAIVALVAFNMSSIWSLRLERETALACYDRSVFYPGPFEDGFATDTCGPVFEDYGEAVEG